MGMAAWALDGSYIDECADDTCTLKCTAQVRDEFGAERMAKKTEMGQRQIKGPQNRKRVWKDVKEIVRRIGELGEDAL